MRKWLIFSAFLVCSSAQAQIPMTDALAIPQRAQIILQQGQQVLHAAQQAQHLATMISNGEINLQLLQRALHTTLPEAVGLRPETVSMLSDIVRESRRAQNVFTYVTGDFDVTDLNDWHWATRQVVHRTKRATEVLERVGAREIEANNLLYIGSSANGVVRQEQLQAGHLHILGAELRDLNIQMALQNQQSAALADLDLAQREAGEAMLDTMISQPAPEPMYRRVGLWEMY